MISATGSEAVAILEKGSVSSLGGYSVYRTQYTKGAVRVPALSTRHI